MKTPEQIREWLQKQEWYPKFVENLENDFLNGLHDYEREEILQGKWGIFTIYDAFEYSFTPEGTEYWANNDIEFIKWYFEE